LGISSETTHFLDFASYKLQIPVWWKYSNIMVYRFSLSVLLYQLLLSNNLFDRSFLALKKMQRKLSATIILILIQKGKYLCAAWSYAVLKTRKASFWVSPTAFDSLTQSITRVPILRPAISTPLARSKVNAVALINRLVLFKPVLLNWKLLGAFCIIIYLFRLPYAVSIDFWQYKVEIYYINYYTIVL